MTKVKALLLSIVCAATAIAFFATQETTGMWAFASGAILFLSIWFYKYQRDHRIQAQARRERLAAAQTSLQAPSVSNLPHINEAYVASLSHEEYGQFLANYYQLGTNPETGVAFLVPMQDRYSGMYVLGNQGFGKSGFIKNLIHEDILIGNSVIVLDPHGDLTKDCIEELPGFLPPEMLQKIYLLDMEDEEYPFGLNIFSSVNFRSHIALGQSINRIEHVFKVLWPEVMSQHNLPRYLRAAVITLLFNPGSTLVDMYHLFTQDGFRHRLLQNVHDHTVRQFWQVQYDDLPPTQRFQRVEPLVGRLESLFMGRTLVRNIVGQRETTIDFRKAIENKEVIFIRLPLKTLGQDARLIGTLLIAQIHAAIFSFADIPEAKRPGFSLYVDEFQHFATPDFAVMFTEGRKFGVRVTVAHQYRDQLPDFLRAATMTARTKVCFRTTPEDGREMAHLFTGLRLPMKPEDIDPKPVEHLLHRGSDNFAVRTFIHWYLLQLQSQRHGGQVEIRNPGIRWNHWPFWVLNVPEPAGNPKVDDPTPYLNNLLYQVEKSGNPNLTIPSQIVYGFSNIGKGFYGAFNHSWNKRTLLSPSISYPGHLVVETDSGLHWTRPPEDGKEQLYHFLFHLRATMSYLAANPIGTRTNNSTSDIAQMLIHLPKRTALVHSGDDVGVIYTEDALPKADYYVWAGNHAHIKCQTRAKYCRQVTGSGDQSAHPAAQQPTVSRWEEVQ